MGVREPQVVTPQAKSKPLPPSARTVVVACKIESGLVLQLQTLKDSRVPDKESPNGYRIEKIWAKGGRRYVVSGPAYPVGQLPKGFPRQPMIEGGYAITRGIPAEFWETWAEQNKFADYFVAPDGAEHGMIYAYPDLDSVVDAAREHDKLQSGMQPLSTDLDKSGKLTDPRMPRPVTSMIAKVGYEPPPGFEAA
jgi:hypothetical protein